MKRLLAILCTLAIVFSIAPTAVFAAENSSLQAAMDDDSFEIIVLEEDASNLTVNRDTTIDLNGHNIDGVSVQSGTLYLLDSQTADYTVADGVYGQVTNVTGNVKAAEGYLQVGNSFHAVNLDIYAMTLRAADVGVYYKSHFAADEIVAAQVESFGVALSVVTAPNASNLETYCGYSAFTDFEAGEGANAVGTSTLLKNIMKASNSDEKNAKNAAMPVYGRAYIKTADGYVFGETVKRSLQEQVEAIDGVWNKLTDAQKNPVLAMLEGYTSVMENWNIPNIRGIQVPGAGADIEIPIEVTAENGVVTEAVTVEANGVSVTVPAGTKLAANATGLTVLVTEKETSDAGLTLDKSEVLMPMDVHVEGLAADNTAPLTIYLGEVMAENLNMGNYAVYHVENGKANEMVLIPVDAEFTAHNQYKYSLDGELTLYMATFSEVAIRSTIKNTWQGGYDYSWYDPNATTLYIRNADQLAAFGAIVGDMAFKEVEVQVGNYTLIDTEPIVEEDSFAGKTVVLLADIDLGDKDDASEHLFYPIGYGNANMSYVKPSDGKVAGAYMQAFEGTFDGNGNTISNFYQNTWQMWGDYDGNNYDSAMGLFAYVNGGTIKNLTVDNFSSDGEFAPTGVIAAYAANAAFENIAITNCNPRVYNTGNGGIVGIGGSSTDGDEDKLTFKNITIDNTNKITALWGSWDVACGGLVGMFYGKGHVNMTNCHVAAQIDVYNDVCGNYQYYWYRYAGMLIGTNKNMVTDDQGYTVPETSKFHAENCTVHFGTWNDYYYCELVENSLASYTHDHQFSRLTLIDSLAEIQDEAGNWNKTGNFMIVSENKCYHVRKDENGFYLHSHDDYNRDGKTDYETVNGETILVENNRCVYLPFNQLFTGYGWGVKHIPLGKFDGVTILPREVADSVQKFEAVGETEYVSGNVLTIDQLFAAKADAEVGIVGGNVQVTVSPADDESTVSGTYVANTTDWTKGTLKFSGMGAATITITDYYFCTPTTITVTVKPVAKIGEIEYASLQNALDAAQDGDTVTLLEDVAVSKYLDIYTPNFGEIERSITLNLEGHSIAPAEDYKYQWYPLVFVGINQTLTIKNGSIVPDEHVAVGVYGAVNLENVNITREVGAEGEEVVCIWNWGEDDKYYQDCQYLLTATATITGNSVIDSVVVEGPVTLGEDVQIDKLYLNTKTGHGKFILPDGYGLVNKGDYYADLHKHEFTNNKCAQDGCGLTLSYVKTELADIKSTDVVVITMAKGGTVYALSSANGTKDDPAAKIMTIANGKISGDVSSDLVWNIANDSGNLTIYPNGATATWLYCTNNNDGVRVGTNANKVFTIDVASGYLKNTATSRYVGVYTTNPDWRCYTSTSTNIGGQTLAFYVLRTSCDHSFAAERETVAPTCKVAGHEAGLYCSDCDTYISGGELINALGHVFGEPDSVKEATCTEKGKKIWHCDVCNQVKTETIPFAHTWNEATCSAPKTCAICGTTEGETVDHIYENGECKWCGAAEPVEPEQPAISGYIKVTDIKDITDGQFVIVANVNGVYKALGTSIGEKIEFEEVIIENGVVTSEDAPVWTLAGGNGTVTMYNGTSYLAYNRDTNFKAQNAAYSITVAEKDNSDTFSFTFKNANTRGILYREGTVKKFGAYATSNANTANTSEYYRFLEVYKKVEVCNHELTIVIDEIPATCTTAGTGEIQKCACGQNVVGGNVIPAKGHTEETISGKNATCTENGLSDGVKCSVCQTVLVAQTTVDALGHNYVGGVCDRCGEQEQTGYELTFMVNGEKEATYIATTIFSGWPGANTIPSGYEFVGWVENAVAETTTQSQTVYNADKAYTVTGDKTFYALFTRTEEETAYFEKVTSSATDWTGEYLIVYETGKVAFNGALAVDTIDADNNGVAVTISNNRIAATDTLKKATFTFALVSEGNYSIKSASGVYVGRTGSSNGMDENTSTAHKHTISYSNNKITIKSSGGPALQAYKSGSIYRFRYYKTSQQAIALYRAVKGTTTYYTTTIN